MYQEILHERWWFGTTSKDVGMVMDTTGSDRIGRYWFRDVQDSSLLQQGTGESKNEVNVYTFFHVFDSKFAIERKRVEGGAFDHINDKIDNQHGTQFWGI